MTDIPISNTQSTARPAILVRLRNLVVHGMARVRAVFRRPARVVEVRAAPCRRGTDGVICYVRRKDFLN